MKRSTERILVTHAGSLPRPPDLWEMLVAKSNGRPYDRELFGDRLRSAVAEVVKKQIDSGIDIVNDGELGKHSFSDYARERLGGFEERAADPEERPPAIFGRDLLDFPEYFAGKGGRATIGRHATRFFCNAPLKYVGHSALKTDIENFKAALQGAKAEEAFLPAVAPGTIEHWMKNEYYPSDEAYLYALADAMHEEYEAIVASGFVLQIDDPDLADGWQLNAHMSLPEYRKFAALRIDALNHALRGIPQDRVRFHMCWGSYHGPHKHDIPLRDIVDLILKVRAEIYSIEASNPRHEHEWRVWEEVRLPDGKALVPGVTGHYSDFIEHPEAIAERLIKYARLVGRENVIAGTDCGLGTRVGHPTITWAKFEAMAEGARLATKRLWGGGSKNLNAVHSDDGPRSRKDPGREEKWAMRSSIRLVALALALLSARAIPVSAQTLIRVATPGAVTGAMPIFVGIKKGIFQKHGLNVEVIATRNEQMNMQALVSDSVQFLTSSSTGLFYLGRQGIDVVGLCSWSNASPYSLASRFKIKEVKELKGNKIASSGAGGRADAFIRFMLAKAGLDYRKDAQIIPLSGGSGIRLAAVVSGNLDATLISPLQGRHAEKLGLTVIPLPLEYIWGINLTRKSFMEKNRGVVRAYIRALAESVRALIADKETTIAVMQRVLRIEDRESLEYSYGLLKAGARPDLVPTEEAIVNVLKTMSYEDPAFLSIPPFKYFDLSFIEELKAEGR